MQQVALIGFGFMGAVHAAVYRALPAVRIAAVVDPRGEELRPVLREAGLDDVPVCPDLASAAARSGFSFVDICLPTDLHREAAAQAFDLGKHVFCEKPIALTVEDAVAMTSSARARGVQFMVGHCIRFWPEYVELKRMVESGEHGRLVSLSLARRNGRPGYSAGNWVNQPERCLGAALDLHIHDTDFLVHLLGTPPAVFSRGVRDATGWSSITTQYLYEDCAVSAEGGWNYPRNAGFQMRFTAVFEHAVLDFDSRQTPSLTLTAGDGEPTPLVLPALPDGAAAEIPPGYYHELAYFVDCLESGKPVENSTGGQAAESLRVTLCEIASADAGKILPTNQ
ncbi:MAG TPA: Gfo/Idh/MocA family oxidoreductase [Terrimicrobiaceae bacterium]|nr:Gfo/Idh/MocA family oxidoreductase [Terrimicrobiaceae bacterium]